MAGKKQRALPVIEQIKVQLETKPFRAFVVESSGGNLIPVSRPEWVFFPPGLNQVVIFTDQGAWHFGLDDIKGVGVDHPLTEEAE
jgi:hypothetical protein